MKKKIKKIPKENIERSPPEKKIPKRPKVNGKIFSFPDNFYFIYRLLGQSPLKRGAELNYFMAGFGPSPGILMSNFFRSSSPRILDISPIQN